MTAATTISGHPAPVPNTPSAASKTARLPSTSLRVQIQAERILASPARYAQSSANDAPTGGVPPVRIQVQRRRGAAAIGHVSIRPASASYAITREFKSRRTQRQRLSWRTATILVAVIPQR